MYKNSSVSNLLKRKINSFNPCFNGSMYKNAPVIVLPNPKWKSFNPCFNGSMYKNKYGVFGMRVMIKVSILVLMDLCIKTINYFREFEKFYVSILVLMDLCIKTPTILQETKYGGKFQSLF